VTRVAIIPARLGSTRFPGKVLASETGRPLIQHVVEAASRSERIESVVVAADDERIREAVEGFGGRCVLTSSSHENGTSRLGEAAALLGLTPDAVVVNVQGDEPEIESAVIDGAIEALESGDAPVATMGVPVSRSEAADPNVVKVVVRRDGRALYFSRALIPHARDGGDVSVLRHVGIYVYRRSFLDVFAGLEPTPLERAERLEQLRILEHGYDISVAIGDASMVHPGIDTPEQYAAFVRRVRGGG
jgi:3-deoxy-manno-octulosonate cytidylyltransferase (CMP-KDO synthetase)